MKRVLLWFKVLRWWLRYRLFGDDAAHWEYQYTLGRWDKLRSESEAGRLDATAKLLLRYAPVGRILEIGCGEGLLQPRTAAAKRYHEWIGIDLSSVAIERAQRNASERVRYLAADMETFQPDGKFDAIVFAESIYYSPNCARLLRKYESALAPDGCFIVSIFRTKRSGRIRNSIHSVTTVIDALTTVNELGAWDCEVLKPKTEKPAAVSAPSAG